MGFLLLSSNVNVEESWYYRLPVDADEEWVSQEEPRKLIRQFHLLQSEADQGRWHFIHWYTSQARPWIRKRLALWEPRIGVAVLDVKCGIWATNGGPVPRRDVVFSLCHHLVAVLLHRGMCKRP